MTSKSYDQEDDPQEVMLNKVVDNARNTILMLPGTRSDRSLPKIKALLMASESLLEEAHRGTWGRGADMQSVSKGKRRCHCSASSSP